MATYVNVEPPFGTGYSNMGGTGSTSWFAPLSDFNAIQMPAANPATPKEKYIIKTPHTMKTGKKFLQMYTSSEKGRLQYEPLGGQDGGGFKVTFTAFVPGESDDLNYMANEIRADWLIFVVPDGDGQLNQVGTKDHKPKVTMAKDTEQITGDGKGYAVNVECYMPFKLLYQASIPLTPAA